MNVLIKACCAVALIGVVSVAAPLQAQAASFGGTWSVSGTIGGPNWAKASPVCTFRQSGSALSGSCRGPNAVGPARGSVNGSRIWWQWRANAVNSIGTSGVATFNGALGSDNVIRGTWTFAPVRGTGTFTAIRP